MSKNQLKTELHIIVYIDLLGVKEIICSDKDNSMLNQIHTCIKECLKLPSIMSLVNIQGCKIKVFSDNIVIAIPSNFYRADDHHPYVALNRMQAAVIFIQRFFLENNLLVRGGVTFGELYIDDVFVWGPALINAYHLENSIALYPRVVIDESIIKIANSVIDNGKMNILELYNLKLDFDGIYFFDYLNYPKDQGVKNIITKSLLDIEEKITKETNKRTLQKMHWHKNYLLYCKNNYMVL